METRIDMSEYKGQPIMSIVDSRETTYPTRIGFGVKKAKMLLANLNAIKAFVEANDKKEMPEF